MARKVTAPDVIYGVLIDRWQHGRWRVRHHRTFKRSDPEVLAQVEWSRRVVSVYPHKNTDEIAKTGLHELLHIGLDLDGRTEAERAVYFLEEWLWKRLKKRQRQELQAIFQPRD